MFARKNYFYPDMPKDYQISPVRPADQRRRLARAARRASASASSGPTSRRTPASRPTSAATGGRIHGSRVLARRLQPRRRARWSRSSAGPTSARAERGPPVRDRAAGDPRRHRRVRREDGGGLDARRRQRVGAPAGRAARHPLRDQERQLACARSGGPSSTRRAARSTLLDGGRAGPPGDAPLGRGRRAHPHPALQGGRRRLPLLPRARPGAARPRRRVGRGDPPRPCRRSPPSAGPRWPWPRAWRPPTRRSRIAVERGRDGLAAGAIEAGGDPARVLVHIEHNLPPEGPDPVTPAALAALTGLEVAGTLTADAGQAGSGRGGRRGRRQRSGCDRGRQGLRGHGGGRARGRGRRSHRGAGRRVGEVLQRARTRPRARSSVP